MNIGLMNITQSIYKYVSEMKRKKSIEVKPKFKVVSSREHTHIRGVRMVGAGKLIRRIGRSRFNELYPNVKLQPIEVPIHRIEYFERNKYHSDGTLRKVS